MHGPGAGKVLKKIWGTWNASYSMRTARELAPSIHEIVVVVLFVAVSDFRGLKCARVISLQSECAIVPEEWARFSKWEIATRQEVRSGDWPVKVKNGTRGIVHIVLYLVGKATFLIKRIESHRQVLKILSWNFDSSRATLKIIWEWWITLERGTSSKVIAAQMSWWSGAKLLSLWFVECWITTEWLNWRGVVMDITLVSRGDDAGISFNSLSENRVLGLELWVALLQERKWREVRRTLN